MKKFHLILCASLILFLIVGVSLAQDETKVITTYYPSPPGQYRAITLDPHGNPPECAAVPENEGMLHYDDGTGGFPEGRGLYCCSKSGGTLDWEFIVGGGGGLWSFSDGLPVPVGVDGYLYTSNEDEDPVPNWNTGIGTTTPAAKLHIDGSGSVLAYCDYWGWPGCTDDGYIPINPDGSQLGAGSRLMYMHHKDMSSAFRVGGVSGTQWNAENIGKGSFAAGYNTIAYGTVAGTLGPSWALAMGYNTTAHGLNWRGEGGNNPVALGYNTTSRGSSIAMGNNTYIEANSSVVMGILDDDYPGPPCVVGPYCAPGQGHGSNILMGRNNYARSNAWAVGDSNVAGDSGGSVSGDHSNIAWGYRAYVSNDNNMAVGLDGSITAPDYCEVGKDPSAEDYEYHLKICGDLHVTGDVYAESLILSTDKYSGTIDASLKAFDMPHPDSSKEGMRLRHASIEAPTAGDNLYRWEAAVENGIAIIDLSDYHPYLNENNMVWVAPVEHFGRGYGEVDDAQEALTIYADSDGKYNVVLIGTRKDKYATKYWQGPEVYIEEAD